jgi:hypothetical protein
MKSEEIIFVVFLIFICVSSGVVYYLGRKEEDEADNYRPRK